jgi:HSP20 family protein
MWLNRWDPFEEMERLTGRFMGPRDSRFAQVLSPAVDVFESDDRIEVKAELPGLNAKDIHIDINDNVLTLSGERHLDREEEREGYRRIERSYGRFARSFTLPRYVDQDNVRAEMRDGVLCLTLPKREQQRGRKIDVKVGPKETAEAQPPRIEAKGPTAEASKETTAKEATRNVRA